MSERDIALQSFLDRHGWGRARRGLLAADASFRRYDRLFDGDRRMVLMDAPPPMEDIRPFVSVARHLSSLGFSAPEILAQDRENGFLLIEDLGDNTFNRVLNSGGDAEALYGLAVDVLIDLHRRPAAESVAADLPPYDLDAMLEEAELLIDWYLPAVTGREISDTGRAEFRSQWGAVLPPVLARGRSLVFRDFHVDNLMWLPGRAGVKACGLLDFQDALAGPGVYDVMSLLDDARRDLDDGLVAQMFDRYLAAFPNRDPDAIRADFAVLGAQRHAKVLGIFTRLWRRDGKAQYLHHLPRVWKLLERSCAHPLLTGLGAWLDQYIPQRDRRIPR